MDRIWKYKFHYLIVLPALLLIVIFKLIPLIQTMYYSFIDYSPFRGMSGSPWVGFDNYSALFEDELFMKALGNTIVMNIGFVLISGTIALGLALSLGSIRSKWIRGSFQTLFLIPYVVPSVFIAGVVINLLSPGHLTLFHTNKYFLTDPSLTKLIIIAVEAFRSLGIPVMIGLASILANQSAQAAGGQFRSIMAAAARAIAAYMIVHLSFLLSSNMELSSNMINSLTRDSGITIDNYRYMIGLMQAQYSLSSAAGTLVFIIQLVLVLLSYLLVRGKLLRDLFSGIQHRNATQETRKTNTWWGTAVSGIYAAVVLLFLYLLIIDPFTKQNVSGASMWDHISLWNTAGFSIVYFVAVVIFMFITVTLAYPLTVKKLPGRNLYKLLLLFVLAVGSNVINEVLLFLKLSMLNTVFSQLILGFFSLASIFVLKSIFNSRYSDLKEQAEASGRGEMHTFFTLYIPKVWKPLLALGVLQFIALWNAYLPSIIYNARENGYSPVANGYRLISSDPANFGDPSVWQYYAIISLPPIILLLVFRKWITSEVLTSQITK
jgi:putative aldouronate transport system permease protein